MKSIAVYCGASHGVSPAYAAAARELAGVMVERGLRLVYGGGNVGLMGVIADEVLRLGGQAVGVIPQALMAREVGHTGLTELHVVRDMHERKALMSDLADGFIAMPGGFGTLEELFEMLTWSQLGIHHKPVGLLNTDGFWDGLLRFVGHLHAQGFVRPPQVESVLHHTHAAPLVDILRREAARTAGLPEHPELR